MAGVYISFPFCGQKCTYCNFASGVFPESLAREYQDALRAEIAGHSWQWTPETLYLGGGSPGDMAADMLGHILSRVPGRPWTEATIEASPGSLSPEKVSGWRQIGINRVSLGVQSFVSGEIARTGRRHTAATVASDVAELRAAGIGNLNIDLIAGLPGQTQASWRESLDWIERLDAPHVSVYMLEIDEDSRLGREILRGGTSYGAADVPSEDATADLYEIAVERLGRIGLTSYEISNFARPGMESRHNLKYWRLEPYAGFGSDAHSFDGLMRSQNAETPGDYVERHRRGEPVRVETSTARLAEERFFVGLRLAEGIQPPPEAWDKHGDRIRRLINDGLLQSREGKLQLTSRGVLLSNEVFQEFIEA